MDGAETGERLWLVGWTASKLEGRSLSATKPRYWRAAINKSALVTDIAGQDGACLAELLLNKGYRLVGAFRRASTVNIDRLDALGIADDVEPGSSRNVRSNLLQSVLVSVPHPAV